MVSSAAPCSATALTHEPDVTLAMSAGAYHWKGPRSAVQAWGQEASRTVDTGDDMHQLNIIGREAQSSRWHVSGKEVPQESPAGWAAAGDWQAPAGPDNSKWTAGQGSGQEAEMPYANPAGSEELMGHSHEPWQESPAGWAAVGGVQAPAWPDKSNKIAGQGSGSGSWHEYRQENPAGWAAAGGWPVHAWPDTSKITAGQGTGQDAGTTSDTGGDSPDVKVIAGRNLSGWQHVSSPQEHPVWGGPEAGGGQRLAGQGSGQEAAAGSDTSGDRPHAHAMDGRTLPR